MRERWFQVRGRWSELALDFGGWLFPLAVGFVAFGRMALPDGLGAPWPHTMIGRWALAMATGASTLAIALQASRVGQRRVFLDQPPLGREIPWWALVVLAYGLWVVCFVFPQTRTSPLTPLAFPVLATSLVLAGGRSQRMAFALLALVSVSLWHSRLAPLHHLPRWRAACAASVDWHASHTAAALTLTASVIVAGLAWRHRATPGHAMLYGTLSAWLLGANGFERARHLDAMQSDRSGWDEWTLLSPPPSEWQWLPHLESLLIGLTLAALVASCVVHRLSDEPRDTTDWRLLAPALLVAIASSQLHWSPRIPVLAELTGRTMQDYEPTMARGWLGGAEVGLAFAAGLGLLALWVRWRVRSDLVAFEGLTPRETARGLPRQPPWVSRGETTHAWGRPGDPYRQQPGLVLDGPKSVAEVRRIGYRRCIEAVRTNGRAAGWAILSAVLGVGCAWVITTLVRAL